MSKQNIKKIKLGEYKMIIKKFSELNDDEMNLIINTHFNHWKKFNDKMKISNTEFKFKEQYTKNDLPFGIALYNSENEIVGFCVLKIENLKKYPEFSPWLSDVMILEKHRGKGYGKELIKQGKTILKELGYETIYVWTDQAPEFYKKLGFQYKQQVEKDEGGYGDLFYIKN